MKQFFFNISQILSIDKKHIFLHNRGGAMFLKEKITKFNIITIGVYQHQENIILYYIILYYIIL